MTKNLKIAKVKDLGKLSIKYNIIHKDIRLFLWHTMLSSNNWNYDRLYGQSGIDNFLEFFTIFKMLIIYTHTNIA